MNTGDDGIMPTNARPYRLDSPSQSTGRQKKKREEVAAVSVGQKTHEGRRAAWVDLNNDLPLQKQSYMLG